MTFLNVVLLLGGLVTVVLTPVFVGHGLSVGSVGAITLGLACLLVGSGIISVHMRLANRLARRETRSAGH